MSEIIYRVQDAQGRGPWKPGFSAQWVEDRPDHDNLAPWYEEFENVLHRRTKGLVVGCGCKTKDQLKRWFTPGEYKTLTGKGYESVAMFVDEILAESDTQCVFEVADPLWVRAVPFSLYSKSEIEQVEGKR